jgi:hypothetical protein
VIQAPEISSATPSASVSMTSAMSSWESPTISRRASASRSSTESVRFATRIPGLRALRSTLGPSIRRRQAVCVAANGSAPRRMSRNASRVALAAPSSYPRIR